MRSKQAGVTLIGWLILLAPMALLLYTGIRLAPVYLNYMKVSRTLERLKTELKESGEDTGSIRRRIQNHFDIESVDYPTIQDLKITKAGRGGWLVEAAYDDQAPLFSNVFILVSFDKTVTVGAGGSN